jgi:hypothetical protein
MTKRRTGTDHHLGIAISISTITVTTTVLAVSSKTCII